jgi:prepilin-type processing-associated H-X9-DG protein
LILPYLDQQPLYDTIDLSKPWNDPANLEACSTPLAVYACPSAEQPWNHTAYFSVVAPNSCFRLTEPRPLAEVEDPAETLLVIEVASKHAVQWSTPQDADERTLLDVVGDDQLPHSGGTNAVFVDGSIAFISTEMPVGHLRALISIAREDNEAYVFE